jgi:hypothetical protein
MDIKFKLIASADETRAELTPGERYIVIYYDDELHNQRAEIALWRGTKFVDYDDETLNKANVSPTFDKTQGRHHIVGWIETAKWRPE